MAGPPGEGALRGASPWREAWRRLARDRAACAAASFLAALALAAVLAPTAFPGAAGRQVLERQLEAPSRDHPFGTDLKGRDLLARTLAAARVSLLVGMAGTAVSLAIGVSYGAVAGYAGGAVDAALMRIVDVLYGLPYIIFVAILSVLFGAGLYSLLVALGAVQWLTMARIVRGQVLALKEREFVEAARALGASPARILVRHICPNLWGPVLAYATLTVPQVLRQEAFLSFLGLGVPAPHASFGSLVAEGVESLSPVGARLGLVAFPGGVLAATLVALNLFSDALRDALDPRGPK